jgi:arylsulfatase A-like enzyme
LLHAYRTPSGKFEIPLILYSPKLLKPQAVRKTVGQIDILPTILDYVGYPKNITVLGNSIFERNTNQFVAHFDNNTYHITKNNWSYGVHLTDDAFLFNKTQDINCLTNLTSKFPQMEEALDSNLKQALYKYFYLANEE